MQNGNDHDKCNRCGKMPCKWNSKKKNNNSNLKSTYFDLKKKQTNNLFATMK